MKKLLIGLFCLICMNNYAETLNFSGHKWYQIMGNTFYTTCTTINEIKELGSIFDFDIEKPSDIIRNLRGDAIKVEWIEYYENFYSDQVKRGNLNQGKYLIVIKCDPETEFFKNNNMPAEIEIRQIRDNAFGLAYKSSKIVELTLRVY